MLLVIAQATVPFEPHPRPGNPAWPEPAAASVQRPPDSAGDRHHVAHRERLRLVADELELRRQALAKDLDAPVDAGDEGADGLEGLAVDPRRLALGDEVDAHGQMRDVAR